MPAISNSSPLILFGRLRRLDLLGAAFKEVLIPDDVWAEVVRSGRGRAGATELAAMPWIHRRSASDTSVLRELRRRLDPGEAEAIALALDLTQPVSVLLDDQKARRTAKQLGIPIVGSAGILVFAKNLGLISEVRPMLKALREAGLRLADIVADQILAEAGEHR